MWTNEPNNTKVTKASYSHVTYDLTENTLDVDIPIIQLSRQYSVDASTTENEPEGMTEMTRKIIQDETVVLQRIAAGFPSLSLGTPKETKINGHFDIYDVDISEVVLMDMILNEPLMNTYLYIEESQKSLADKDRIYIHYKSLISSTRSRENAPAETTEVNQLPQLSALI